MQRATIFVVLDALGYDLIEERDFLADLAPYRYRIRTVLGCAAATIPTLLTGTAPADHGRWMLFSYAPDHSPFRHFGFLRHLPRSVAHSRRVRATLARMIAHRLHWTGEFGLLNVPLKILPFLDYWAKRDPFEPGGLSPCATAIDRLHQERIPFFLSDRHADDARNFQEAAAALRAHTVPFTLIHARELDPVLRRHGPHSEAAREKLAWYEDEIRQLYEAARGDETLVRLYIGSDRGVTEVTDTVNVISRVEGAGLAWGSDYFAFYEPTMACFWFADAQARHRIMASIADIDRGRWLADDQLRIEGVYFPDHRYGQAIFLLEPGLVIAPSYRAPQAPVAAGGYHPEHPGSWAAFCANFPLEIPPRLLGDLSELILEGARWTST